MWNTSPETHRLVPCGLSHTHRPPLIDCLIRIRMIFMLGDTLSETPLMSDQSRKYTRVLDLKMALALGIQPLSFLILSPSSVS